LVGGSQDTVAEELVIFAAFKFVGACGGFYIEGGGGNQLPRKYQPGYYKDNKYKLDNRKNNRDFILVSSILNAVDPLASVSNLYLDNRKNKYNTDYVISSNGIYPISTRVRCFP
jgi:hypothetical protein